MIAQVSAGIVVYHKVNNIIEYLILQYGAGHWDFAKGKLEEGETKLEAAIRELQEETSLDNVIIHDGFEEFLVYKFKDFQGHMIKKTVYFFVGEIPVKGNVILSREHKDFLWLPFDQAVRKLTYQNAKDILTYADAFLQNNNAILSNSKLQL